MGKVYPVLVEVSIKSPINMEGSSRANSVSCIIVVLLIGLRVVGCVLNLLLSQKGVPLLPLCSTVLILAFVVMELNRTCSWFSADVL